MFKSAIVASCVAVGSKAVQTSAEAKAGSHKKGGGQSIIIMGGMQQPYYGHHHNHDDTDRRDYHGDVGHSHG